MDNIPFENRRSVALLTGNNSFSSEEDPVPELLLSGDQVFAKEKLE